MSNRAQRRAAGRRRAQLNGVCVFCEAVELLDHIDGKIVPTLTDDRERMSAAVLQARQAFASMEDIVAGQHRVDP